MIIFSLEIFPGLADSVIGPGPHPKTRIWAFIWFVYNQMHSITQGKRNVPFLYKTTI